MQCQINEINQKIAQSKPQNLKRKATKVLNVFHIHTLSIVVFSSFDWVEQEQGPQQEKIEFEIPTLLICNFDFGVSVLQKQRKMFP